MPFKRRTRKRHRFNIACPQYGSQNELGDTSESGPLFSLYSKMVEVEKGDESLERIQKNVEVILLFNGLFLATLAALITVSIQDLRPGQQDSSSFSPPTYAIWVNSLWISSLIINIISALLATLIQQWACRYDRITQPPGSPHNRARIRQYIFSGGVNSHFLLATDAVPSLLHISVFLFFAGLLILLRHISHTVFNAVVGWIALCVVYYVYITFLPIFWPDSPYYSPISSLAWQLYSVFEPLSAAKRGIRNMDIRLPAAHLLQRLEERVKETVLDKSPSVDASILESLLVNLDEDGAREKFLEAIPGFYDSQAVHVQDMSKNLSPTFFTNFRRTVNLFLDQTLSSDSVSEVVRSHRLLACVNATQTVLGESAGTSITDKIIRSGNWNVWPPSPEMAHIVTHWRNSTSSSVALIGNCIIAQIIATVKKRGDTWMALTTSQLGVTEEALSSYLEHGDSALLANLIKTTRLFFEKDLQFQGILRSIAEFNVMDTLPELQQNFCTLWNEIVEKNKHSGDYIFILDEICHIYAALHAAAPATVAAGALPTSTTANNDNLPLESSYALCADPQSHHPHHSHNASPQRAAVATSSYNDGESRGRGGEIGRIHRPHDDTFMEPDFLTQIRVSRRSPAWMSSGWISPPPPPPPPPRPISPRSSSPHPGSRPISPRPPHRPLDPLQSDSPPFSDLVRGESPIETGTYVAPLQAPPDSPYFYADSFAIPLHAPFLSVAGESDVQDLNAHDPHQSDPPAGDSDLSMSTLRAGESVL